MNIVKRLHYSTGQAAHELGVSPNWIRTLIATGRLQAERTPLGSLIPVDEVQRLKRERRAEAAPAHPDAP